MEPYRLNSRILEDDKEFLIQTSNDFKLGIIKTSIFVNGDLLDASVLPHSDNIAENEILKLVKGTHAEKKSELEYLLKSYREVLERGQPKIMYYLGTALFFKRMYPEAERLLRTAAKLKNDFHEAYYFLSMTSLALNRTEVAVNAGSRAVELRPEFADYRNNLGEVYLAYGSCKRAAIEFREAIKKNVYYADAYFNLGLAYIFNAVKKEDFDMYRDLTDRCLDLFKKAVLISPDYQTGIYDEAVSWLKSGDIKRALSLFRTVREDKKERVRLQTAGYFNRFLIYTDWASEKNIRDRIDFLKNEINKNPHYVDLYYDLALCHLYRAKFSWQKGIEYFKKALEMNRNLRKGQRAVELAEDHFLRMSDTIFDISEEHDS
jgi:tetratricopeptide (TPR) repeat protein